MDASQGDCVMLLATHLAGFGVGGTSVAPGSIVLLPGTTSWEIPAHNEIIFELYGAGGSGSNVSPGVAFYNGNNGGDTTISSLSLVANGGGAGVGSGSTVSAGGAGGTASGGDINTAGENGGGGSGGTAGTAGRGNGGDAPGPEGGLGGTYDAVAPHTGEDGADYGGGGAAASNNGSNHAGAGGSGAYCKKTISSGTLKPGASLTVAIGVGGAVGGTGTIKGGVGGDGAIKISWS
jgi:hypothetical protein